MNSLKTALSNVKLRGLQLSEVIITVYVSVSDLAPYAHWTWSLCQQRQEVEPLCCVCAMIRQYRAELNCCVVCVQ